MQAPLFLTLITAQQTQKKKKAKWAEKSGYECYFKLAPISTNTHKNDYSYKKNQTDELELIILETVSFVCVSDAECSLPAQLVSS